MIKLQRVIRTRISCCLALRLGVLLTLFCLLSFFESWAQSGDQIIIDKHSRTLSFFRDDKRLLHCPISIGINTVTHKTSLQDYATPEGEYHILYKKNSKLYGWFLGMSYPNEADAWLAFFYGRIDQKTLGRIVAAAKARRFPPQDTALGGALGIHGGGVVRKDEGGAARDWTRGCVALNDEDMLRLYRMTKVGANVRIFDSSKGFYARMRSFVQPEMESPVSTPLAYWSGMLSVMTDVGRLELRLWENREMVRRMEIQVFDEENRPFLSIIDTNADEKLDELDVVSCLNEMACNRLKSELHIGKQDWNEVYQGLRTAIVKAYFRY